MPDQQHIVAIGASAGGLEALSSFFDHTPVDGVSYVIIPHLSPDFKSRMVEILSRHSKLQVVEAAEQMSVDVNRVYLIPNTKYMGIKNGRLFLIDKASQHSPHMTIDTFFTSLAQDIGNKSIGVILSGTGADGSKGCVSIQNSGGIILVQDPNDAKFDGMPNAAIATSSTSYILPAEAMPFAIEQYVHGESQSDIILHNDDLPLNQTVLSQILNLIQEHFPLDFTEYKVPTLMRRIKRRMAHNQFIYEGDYYNYLRKNIAEIELLINDILIGVTSFFRDPEAFAVLEQEVFPRMIDEKSEGEQLKLWIACCATGEEAYSMAILVDEYLVKKGKNLDVKIFATDINRAALDKAAKGVFSFSILKSVSKERLANYFELTEGSYKVKQVIRKMLIFARHDLTKNPPYCNVDLISCRNMLIYIKPILQKQVLSKLSFGIQRNGFLMLGSSENISVAKNDFTEINSKWKIYQCTRVKPRTRPEGPLTAVINDIALNQVNFVQTAKPASDQPVPDDELVNIVFQESGFAGVTIDSDNKVVHSFGDLGPYLKQERFNLNLHELLPEPLAIAFNATVSKVAKLNQRIKVSNIRYVGFNLPEAQQADLIISPVQDKKTKKKRMLVLFKLSLSPPVTSNGEDFNIDTHTKEYITHLEEELEQHKNDLQSSNEFMESSREAMQSYNEELISANEEMQSANEELQSINEELETINSEHKSTIHELTELNDDLNNYFRSNRNGQLFVDKDMLLKKYSPGAVKHINVRNGDIGRPLSNITTNIKFETIIDDIKSVLVTGESVVQEVEGNNQRIYQVTTSPYFRQSDDKIYGAVISFYDITDLKKIQQDLDNSNKMLGLTTELAGMGTWMIDLNTSQFSVSQKFRDITGLSDSVQLSYQEALEMVVHEQKEKVIAAIKNTIDKGAYFDIEFSIERDNDKKLCWVRAIGDLIHDQNGKPIYFTGLIQDITDKKLDELRKNDFLAMASHELKTQLTSLQGYLQILAGKIKTREEDPFIMVAVNKSQTHVKKMISLIHSFLDTSRLESGKIRLDMQTFNVVTLVTEVIEDLMLTNVHHDIVLHSSSPISVSADREKIGEVIQNLLSNAIKYSPHGKSIEVSVKESHGQFQFKVIDQGSGIKTTDKENIFNRFYRVDNGDLKSIPGFGIGLYLSAEIIKRHNGKIWVESDFGKGSTFYFNLPMKN